MRYTAAILIAGCVLVFYPDTAPTEEQRSLLLGRARELEVILQADSSEEKDLYRESCPLHPKSALPVNPDRWPSGFTCPMISERLGLVQWNAARDEYDDILSKLPEILDEEAKEAD